MNRTLRLTAFILFLAAQMTAQPLPCFTFEDIPAGTQLGPASGNSPGDVLFSEAGIEVSIQEIIYPDGSTGFGNAMVYDASSGWLDGQFFFMGNNSLQFNLSQADGALNQLCFDFFDGGGVENFAINGSDPAILNNFPEVENLSFPGVAIEVGLTDNSTLAQGTVCITGDIEQLLIGGQEFGIDNVCADAVLDCPIANLQAEIVSCDDAGNYNIEIDFDWLSPLTVIASFDILVEGEQAAFITQSDLPYLLEGVQPATDALDFTLTVCQNDNPDCCESIILRKQCPAGGCMEFEGLSEPVYGNSTGLPPGQAFYDESGISLRLIPFQGLFWTTTYGGLIVLDEASAPEMTAASGQYLKFESVNAVFDLTGYPDPVDSVVVDFYYNGGAINLAANGSSILIQNNLAPGLYALAPGITVRVVFDGDSAVEGQLIFNGNVQSLLIGGEGDFRIDNLCVNPVDEPCELSNMSVEVGPCNNDGTFSATIDFDYQGASDSFILSGPGALETFAYADLPVTIADAPINNSGIYAYYATDTGAGLCWVGDTIQAEPCTGCAFEGLSIDYQGLADNGQNVISLDLNLTGPTLTDFFTVYFDGEPYEQFGWNDVPLRLTVPCNTTSDVVQAITVCEGEDHCCITLPLIYLEPCVEPCSVTGLELTPGPCNPNNVFEVKLDFDYRNTSDTFELWLNGNATGRFFAYADLPVTVGPFVAPTNELAFTVVDTRRPDCGGSAVLPAYNCGGPCVGVDSVAYELTDCMDDGTFGIRINEVVLETPDPSLSPTIFVRVNGQGFGSFNLNGLPYILFPLAGNGATVYEVVLTTANTAACGYSFTVTAPDCGSPCPTPVDSVAHYLTDCDGNGNYFIVLEQVYPNPPNLAFPFYVAVDGQSTGIYTLADLPIELGPYSGNGFTHEVAVYTQNTPACPYTFTTEPVSCPGACPLESVSLVDIECNYSDFYRAVLRVEGAAVGDVLAITSTVSNFSVTAAYTGDGIVVEMPDTGQNYDELTVCLPDDASTIADCCVRIAFDYPCRPCDVFDVRFDPLACNDDNSFSFVLDFDAQGVFSDTFTLQLSNGFEQIFLYADLPVTLGPIPGLGEQLNYWLTNESGNCGRSGIFLTPDCIDGCVLGQATTPIAAAGCNDDGTYNMPISIENAQLGDLLLVQSAVTGYSDTLTYGVINAPLLQISGWPAPPNGQETLNICFFNQPDCCTTITFPVDCPCPWLAGVTITPNDCRDDGTFTAVLDITTPAPAIGNIFIVESENYLEEFSVADLPVEIGPFFGTGDPRTVHVFFPNTDCRQTVTFITPGCGNGGCAFTSVIAEPHSCDGNRFLVDVEVRAVNPGALGYFIFADGQINGPFSYNEPFVTLGPFEGDGSTVYDFLILDAEDPTCFGYAEVGPIDCGMTCNITNLLVQPLGCNDDGTYNVFLNFDVVHPGNDFFEVYGRNGNLINFYRLDELPIVVEGLRPSDSGEGYLRVCINDNPNCCEEIEFPEPNCPGACRISDVQAEFDRCDADGNYYVRLSFNVENPDSDGFRVFGNGQDYGVYSYTMPFPVIVGPITPTGALVYELIVADLNNPDCRGFTEFEAFDCNDDNEVCITFDEFETLVNDTVGLAVGNPMDSIYDEDGVVFNAVAVPLGNNINYFEWVFGSALYPCGPVAVPLDGNLYINGGIEMDFGQLADIPTSITFDVFFCNSPSTIPQIVIGANGELYSGPITDLPGELPGGVGLEFIPLANTLTQGQVIISGPVESLLIGGRWMSIDNLCFNQPGPVVDDCVSFDVYDGFPMDTLANYGQPQDMEYEEDGVVVTASGIDLAGIASYFGGVYDYANGGCGFGDDDAALSFGGALRFSFAALPNLPTETSFDVAFCATVNSQFILLDVNGQEYRGQIAGLPDMLGNVAISAQPSTNSSSIWTIELAGTVEAFTIGGPELSIDDVCFNRPGEETEVWPGDANADNLAHHIDLLNIGLAYGYQGQPRFEDGASWAGVTAADWPQSFANDTNYKHADCNGDGVVDDADRQVLIQNYGLAHGPRAAVPDLPGTDTDPPVYADFPVVMPVGASFTIPVILGSRSLAVQDIYGIAFTLEFDPQVFNANAFEVSYPVSWFGEPGVNTMAIDRTYADEGRLEVAITRTDQNNVSGHGAIAYLIGIIDDIAGFQPAAQMVVRNVVAIGVNEERIPLQGRTVAFELDDKEETPPADAKGVFSVFPNPTSDWITVTSKYGYQPEQLTLLTLDGREVRAPQEENRRILLQGLPAGTYILSIRTGETRVHKMVVKE